MQVYGAEGALKQYDVKKWHECRPTHLSCQLALSANEQILGLPPYHPAGSTGSMHGWKKIMRGRVKAWDSTKFQTVRLDTSPGRLDQYKRGPLRPTLGTTAWYSSLSSPSSHFAQIAIFLQEMDQQPLRRSALECADRHNSGQLADRHFIAPIGTPFLLVRTMVD